jgi:drug/metabolite transporter (DMT)-like permease
VTSATAGAAIRSSSRARGLTFVVVASILFAINGTVSKAALLAGMSALQLTQIRVTGAFIGLFVLVAVLRPHALRVARREWPALLVYGVIGIIAVQAFYFIAIRRLPVGIALLIEYTAPLLVALWARFGQGKVLPRRFWGALALALLGLSFVAQVWPGLSDGDAGSTLDTIGVLAGFGAAVSLAVYFILGEKGIGEGGRDVLSFTMLGFGVATAVMAVAQPWWNFPFATLSGTSSVIEGIPEARIWVLVLWVVVLGTLVPYLFTLASMGHLTAAAASVASMLEPVLAGVIAWIVLGETLSPVQLAGAAVLLIGVVIAELSGAHPMPTDAAIPERAAPNG